MALSSKIDIKKKASSKMAIKTSENVVPAV
jgi:hypothetical protein